jgi:predicted N-acetyltransferase YhbS
MNVKLRAATNADAATLGTICFEAFAAMSDKHNFPRDFDSVGVSNGMMQFLTTTPGIYGVVAEANDQIVGSNFIDERSPIPGIGPITIDPKHQNGSVGRALMNAVLDRVKEQHRVGVRLVQAAWHGRSAADRPHPRWENPECNSLPDHCYRTRPGPGTLLRWPG